MHNLHFFRKIVWNMSRIFSCLLEFFMSRICPVLFVRNLSRIFSCLEYVQFYLSRICPEFFMSRICPEKISGIFHVQNLSSLFVQNLSRFFVCLEYVQKIFLGFFFMSRICPVFWTWKNSGHQFRSFFRTLSGHFPDMENEFRTISLTFSGHFFFIGQFDS